MKSKYNIGDEVYTALSYCLYPKQRIIGINVESTVDEPEIKIIYKLEKGLPVAEENLFFSLEEAKAQAYKSLEEYVTLIRKQTESIK